MPSDIPPKVTDADEPKSPRAWAAAAAIGLLVIAPAIAVSAFIAGQSNAPLLPPLAASVTIVHDAPNVLLAVRDLARLESAEYHLERVIDLREKQSTLFGLVNAEDAILLVAVGDVSAGVDLGKLREGDVKTDWSAKSATIVLPPAEVFSAKLDNDKTYVHTRKTDVLAERKEALEGKARARAEAEIEKAAMAANIIEHANTNARRTVEGLVRSLGYADVTVTTR